MYRAACTGSRLSISTANTRGLSVLQTRGALTSGAELVCSSSLTMYVSCQRLETLVLEQHTQ